MKKLSRYLRRVLPHALPMGKSGPFLILAGLVGMGGGFSALIFRSAFNDIQQIIDPGSNSMTDIAASLPWWGRLLLPMAGGGVGGILLTYGLKWVPRRGADDYLEAITIGDGVIGFRQTIIKLLSSLCSIGTGASIGREGPMVQFAAMIGSTLGQKCRLSRTRMRLLVACGATAGITSAYNAPIAGSIFVVEIAMGSLSKAVLGPLIVASVIANMVTRWFFGLNAVYELPHFTVITGWEVFAYAGLGIICGFIAPAFRWVLDYSRKTFLRISRNLALNMALGGLGVGAILVWEPDVWGNGYGVVNSILHDPWSWQTLLVLLLLKVIATALCSGSGTVGGIFTPTLFVGAALGALYGHVLVSVSSLSDTVVSGYVMVGMGAFLASVTYAPLMSILMIFEMTLSYQAILPLMLACVIGHYIAHSMRPAFDLYPAR